MTVLGTSAKAQSSAKEQKVLVAYFSRSGNTRAVADHIKSLTGGDLFEIQVANPYPEEYHACTEVAKKEKRTMQDRHLKQRSIISHPMMLSLSASPIGGAPCLCRY